MVELADTGNQLGVREGSGMKSHESQASARATLGKKHNRKSEKAWGK